MIGMKYTCDRCQVDAYHSDLPRFYKLADDIECRLDANRVWCYDCNTVRSAETFPSADSLKREIERLRRGELADWELEIASFLDMSPAQRLAELLKQATAHLGWLDIRQSSPRCLECSSTHFVRIAKRQDDLDDCFEHPGCGGTFQSEESYFGSVREFPLYDAEGFRLNDF